MVKSFLLFIVSVLLFIARRSGEQAGRKSAINEIQAATQGSLLDLQTRIKAKQTAVEEKHAKYKNKLPDIWPDDGIIDLHKLEADPIDPDKASSADLQIERS